MQTRSLQVQMPGGLSLPLAFGMNTRRIGSLVRNQFGRSHRLIGSSASMVHISPWEATLGMIKEPPRYFLRGRLSISTVHTNAKGSQRLRATRHSTGACRDRNPNWGLRDLEAVAAMAQSVGFSAPVITEMPGKQSERGVPPDVIWCWWDHRPANGRFRNRDLQHAPHWER